MTPETAAYRLVCALTLGAALGLLYGFLRPLRPKHTVLADGLFLLGVFWVWLYYNFALCGGDIRLGCCGGLLAGGLAWERTAGRWLRPVFWWFWLKIQALWRLTLFPVKKFSGLAKILFASAKNGLQ